MPTYKELVAVEKAQKELKQAKSSREQSVSCRRCFKRQTWNNNAICNGCQNEK